MFARIQEGTIVIPPYGWWRSDASEKAYILYFSALLTHLSKYIWRYVCMYFYKYTVLLKYLKIQLDTILKIILVELVIVKCRTLKLVARMLKLFCIITYQRPSGTKNNIQIIILDTSRRQLDDKSIPTSYFNDINETQQCANLHEHVENMENSTRFLD